MTGGRARECVKMAVLAGALVLSPRAHAQQPRLSLEELAASWGGGTKPTCEFLSSGADLPPQARAQNCTWPSRGTGAQYSRLSGIRSELLGWGAVTLERHVADSVASRALADSLEIEFQARGFKAYDCPYSGRRWQAPGFVVQFSPGVAGKDGLFDSRVMATTMPGTLPDILCPDAPNVKMPDRPAAGRSASTSLPDRATSTSR